MARVLLASFGSLGDLHPYLALGLGLRARGHAVTLATSESYRQTVTAAGLGFHPARPALEPDDPQLAARVMDGRRGTEYIFKSIVMPNVRDTYADLRAAAADADVFVSGSLVYVAPTVAATSSVRWVSSVLQPLVFFSARDPSVLPGLPAAERLARLGPGVNRALVAAGRRVTWPWTDALRRLRRELGLEPGPHPLYEGQHAPGRVLALFSPTFAAPQPDWPPQARATGFLYHDEEKHDEEKTDERTGERSGTAGLPRALERFLAAGEPPIVFTLGSAAVHAAGDFYAESLRVAVSLGARAVLLTGRAQRQRLPATLPGGAFACDYAPYAALFARAAAIVHQGGVGTTGQALRAGRPMLVVPFAHDQPDNAARVARLGAGLALPRGRYRADRAAPLLARLLGDRSLAASSAALGSRIRSEDGVRVACDLLEDALEDGR